MREHLIYRHIHPGFSVRLALTAAARIVWLVAKHPNDDAQNALLPIKPNLVEWPPGIGFRIDDGRVAWSPEPDDIEADAVLVATVSAERV